MKSDNWSIEGNVISIRMNEYTVSNIVKLDKVTFNECANKSDICILDCI